MANPNPNEATRFQQGNPGGPGRPRGYTARSWMRIKLAEIHPKHPDKTRCEVWAETLIDEAETKERDMLDVLKFLEGNTPPDGAQEPPEPRRPTSADGRILAP